MPIHVSDVIEELLHQNDNVQLFTSIRSSFLKNCSWQNKIRIVNIPTINIRILNRFFYSILLAILLPFWCLKNKPDIIYERVSFSTVITVIISRVLGIPIVSEVNGIVVEELKLAGHLTWRIKITQLCEYFSLKYSNLIIAVTEEIKRWLIKTYNLPLNKVEVVTNGVNIRRFFPRNQDEARTRFYLPAQGKLYIGYLGTLTPWCGVELLIECAPKVLQEFPQVEFLVGGGQQPYLDNFKHLVKQGGLQNNFKFYGNIPWSEAPFFISAFDIAILSVVSLPSGTSPQKLYAYLACNKPVIGSDTGEVGDTLKHYNVGLTFKPGNYESLGARIIELLNNPKDIYVMAEKGHQVVAQNNSWTVKVNQLKKLIYNKIFKSNAIRLA
jgi:glycosyltransferase involved in cell wall biosynthesis